jgi:hypothetical protein
MALLFTVLLAVSASILGYFLIDFGKRDFLRETEAAIDTEIRMLSSLESTESTELAPYIQQRIKDDQVVQFRLESESGKLLAGTIDPMPRDVRTIAEGILRFDLKTDLGTETFAAKIHTFKDGSRLVVARNIDVLTLTEHFDYYDGKTQERVWTIKKLDDGSYEGTASDIIDKAIGKSQGSAVNWSYVMDVPVDDTTYRLRFDDWMWVMNDGVLINRSYLKKFGITVSELTIFMQKQKP